MQRSCDCARRIRRARHGSTARYLATIVINVASSWNRHAPYSLHMHEDSVTAITYLRHQGDSEAQQHWFHLQPDGKSVFHTIANAVG